MENDNDNNTQLPSEAEVVENKQPEEVVLNSDEKQKEVGLPSDAGKEATEEAQEEPKEESKEETKEESKEESQEESPDWHTKYKEEFEKTGEVSEDSIQEIIKERNLPENLVREYIELSKASANMAKETAEREILSTVGGKESYEEMVKWGAENLTKEEIASFDKQITVDVDSAKMAVSWLKSKFVEAGNGATLIEGKAARIDNGYKSAAEFQKDIGDPRYTHDPKYRAKVNAKLDQTTINLY